MLQSRTRNYPPRRCIGQFNYERSTFARFTSYRDFSTHCLNMSFHQEQTEPQMELIIGAARSFSTVKRFKYVRQMLLGDALSAVSDHQAADPGSTLFPQAHAIARA